MPQLKDSVRKKDIMRNDIIILPDDITEGESVMKHLKRLPSGKLRLIKTYCQAILAERQKSVTIKEDLCGIK